jgi:hypothetical protein
MKINLNMPIILFILWVAGIFLAKGFWSTFFAVITFGLWSIVLVVEKVLQVLGWL